MTASRAERNARYAERVRRGLVEPRPRPAVARPPRPSPAVEQLARLTAAVPMPRELRVSAPCRGRWAIFDPQAEGEHRLDVAARHAAAVEFCGHCRLLSLCRAWVASLPENQRPGGVVAGQINP
ncbi:hypothetical protein ACK87K_06075 [Mycobacterium intracellulare]|uniref:hypothetical protein n=1 Tax=Mycobacterium intracellulare TaxID=1767 RepID=UPI0039773DFB